jgi:hypothetical protein
LFSILEKVRYGSRNLIGNEFGDTADSCRHNWCPECPSFEERYSEGFIPRWEHEAFRVQYPTQHLLVFNVVHHENGVAQV